MGMLYLKNNPLLRQPLELEHTKPRLLGYWGSDAGQCFTYIHFNRLINKYDLNAIYISGPGHGAPAVLSQAYLEDTYSSSSTLTGLACQTLSPYSRIARSEENLPIRAVLRMDIRTQLSFSL